MHRTALAVTGGDMCPDPGFAFDDDYRVAFVRAPPPVCPACGKEGLTGVLFLACCGILAKDAIRCDTCGCLILVSQFNRTGCKAHAMMPMCAPADGDGAHIADPPWSRQHIADGRAGVRVAALLLARESHA